MKTIRNLYLDSLPPGVKEKIILPFRTADDIRFDWVHIYEDSSWPMSSDGVNRVPPKGCTILSFPGSGATNHPDTSVWVDTALAAGYRVYSVLGNSYGVNGGDRFTTMGYGSTGNPMHTSLYIQGAWNVEAHIEYCETFFPTNTLILRGHSLGGGWCMAWASLANTAQPVNGQPVSQQFRLRKGKVLGAQVNGMTSAGLGNLAWNDVYKVMNYVADFATKIKDIQVIMSYGTEDPFAPQDFSRSIQLALPKESSVYLVYPTGEEGHGWADLKPNLMLEFFNAIYYGRAPVMEDGKEAVIGNGQF